MNFYHSVTLDIEKCKGCTNCIKGCPTEAIRVRNGKAFIMQEKCIDCGECIRVCPNQAKFAATDNIDMLKDYKFTIALPAPSFYAQFKEGATKEAINAALRASGFDEVYEVPLAAEEVTAAIREYIMKNKDIRPFISSSCPAVLRLIRVRFPGLIRNIVPVKAPVEIAAKRAKETVKKLYGLEDREIGAFFISPCPAKVTAVKQPIGASKSYVDGVLSMSKVYAKVLKNIGKGTHHSIFGTSGSMGVGWGRAGGENEALDFGNRLAVDGIHDCIEVLEEVELGRLADIDYLELQACSGGCVGGVLTPENRFIAGVRLKKMAEKLASKTGIDEAAVIEDFKKGYHFFEEEIKPVPAMKLDEDMAKAIKKMELLERILKELPGLDCGSCGSPNCRALAEDIVQGRANETDCVFKLREKVRQLVEEVMELSQKLPPTMEG
ncbi:Iron only hydrogenase large subunit, C-terminal domain [Caldanaerovirga acetigignens]|jgi:iron only hydrogenase large subunit-like protein|uniref:Iron only hydrogenase large subunit, C-terminal domain n=1 Tax=Caldanaerovirga acetigignens TaxID=447595 RepID=A0A1M7KDU9_9FIRM|nr:[Fe-Fe] hydrogenase large subunit C-terminal domain-containing protein [Caldanaerovirga acetigignens]SHM63416.1 Iron only hydrogenase large subunit, C-terminal domain [Caldanaerovirga acetigignens]